MKKILFPVLLLFTSALYALEPVILNEEKGEYPLGLYLEILEDKEGKLTIDEIQKPEMEKIWIRSTKEIPSFGFSKSVYWTRFSVKYPSTEKLLLEIGYPHLDSIELYTFNTLGKNIHRQAGDLLPFKAREVDFRNFVFIIEPNESLSDIYYFRFQSESSMIFPISFWSPIVFAEKKNTEIIGHGIYFGIMLAMILYNLFVWLSVRDKAYFYYVNYILFTSFFILNHQGLTYQYIWIGSSKLYNQIYPAFIILTIIFSNLFTLQFLQVKVRLPIFNYIFKIIFTFQIISILLLPILSYRNCTFSAILLAIVSSFWMFSAGIIMANKKYPPARFFILAWSAFLMSVIIFALKNLGFLPKNNFTEYSLQIGSTVEVILLSLGLADRINDLKKQNELGNLKTLEAEKKSSKIKDEFLSNLSHELKTPLSVVYAYSQMLTDNQDNSEKVRKYSSKIFDSAKTLNNYLSDLILISDLESDLQLQIKKNELQNIIIQAVDEYIPLIKEKNIQLEMKISDKMEINCDPILLKKAISAIFKNAVVYNKESWKIYIDVEQAQSVGDASLHQPNRYQRNESETNQQNDKALRIKITDTGIGIAKEFHKKVFEKFFRIDSSLTYEVSGVGVGLFIAKKIVELHKGEIFLEEGIESGIAVTVNMPLL